MWFLLLWGLLLLVGPAHATDRYLACETGSDAAAGTSAGTAWRTISKYNTTAAAGDDLLLKHDETCVLTTVQLTPKGGVTSYGGAGYATLDARTATASLVSVIALSSASNNQTISKVHVQTPNLAVRGIRISPPTSGITIDNVKVEGTRNFTSLAATGSYGIVFVEGSTGHSNATVRNSKVWNIQHVGVMFRKVNGGLMEYNYIHDNNNSAMQPCQYDSSNIIARYNTLASTANDPTMYLSACHTAEVYGNFVYAKPPTQQGDPVYTLGVEDHSTPTSNITEDVNTHHNVFAYTRGSDNVRLMMVGNALQSARLRNNTVCNNTILETLSHGSTAAGRHAFSIRDFRSPTGPGHFTGNTLCENLFWENGANTTISLQAGYALPPSDRNLYQTATTVGGNLGTNAITTNTVPFVSWTANDVLNDNLNLTATTAALNGGATGLSIGALHPPQMQSREVRNAAPNVVRVTWATPWPVSSCDGTKFTPKVGGSARTVSGCTVVSNTVTDVTFGGAAVVQGQSLTLDVAQAAVKTAMVGCATALCQTFGTTQYENYLWNESFAVTAVPVTNSVVSGCAPAVTNCTVPDSATDDHVVFDINTCSSNPVVPASGVTGFTITEQDAGTKACATFTRTGQTQLDCDTTAITAGKAVTWTYGAAAGTAPTTAALYSCVGANETPVSPALFSNAIDSDQTGVLQRTSNECRGPVTGHGSAWYDLATFATPEVWATVSDTEAANGHFVQVLIVTSPGTAGPNGYALRHSGISPGAADILGLYTLTGGVYALLTEVVHEWDGSPKGLWMRQNGGQIEGWSLDSGVWTLKVSAAGTLPSPASIGWSMEKNEFGFAAFGGGSVTTSAGNVTNTAGIPLPTSSGSCTNNVAAPPAAPQITDLRISAANPQQIEVTIDPVAGTMTGCTAGFSCTQNGAAFPLASSGVGTSPVILLATSGTMQAAHTYACSYAPATGNCLNSPGGVELAAVTNAPVLNTLAPTSLVRTQHSWRLHQFNEPGGLAANSPHWLGPANTPAAVMPGGFVAVLYSIGYTGDASPAESLAFRCMDDGGAPYEPQDTYSGKPPALSTLAHPAASPVPRHARAGQPGRRLHLCRRADC